MLKIAIMPCLPQSGGCERPFTDALVAYLNRTEGTHYVHLACLDITERTSPQPEALYADTESGHQLVIERKSVSWPDDYPYRHNNDHVVGDVFSHELKDLAVDDLYEIRLPLLMEGKRAELQAYALHAAKEIRANWSSIATGSALKGRAGDQWWWAFHKLPEWDREDDASKGLKITWMGSDFSWEDILDPAQLPNALSSAIEKIYKSCSAKFASYPEARRILLIDPHGDLQTESAEWWRAVCFELPPPSQIGEIWSGVFDWVADDTKDWVFEHLYSASAINGSPSPTR